MNSFDLVHIFSGLPPTWATFLIAMVPVAELQAAIPVALGVYHLPFWQAYAWALAGNLVPVFFLLTYLGPVSEFLQRHSKICNRFFTWLFSHTRGRLAKKYLVYGEWALFVFIAIPTPFSGAWSSSVAAFVFGVPSRRALLLISAGELIAGLIIAGIYQGVFTFF